MQTMVDTMNTQTTFRYPQYMLYISRLLVMVDLHWKKYVFDCIQLYSLLRIFFVQIHIKESQNNFSQIPLMLIPFVKRKQKIWCLCTVLGYSYQITYCCFPLIYQFFF